MNVDFGLRASYTVAPVDKQFAINTQQQIFFAHNSLNVIPEDAYDTFLHITFQNSIPWIAALSGDLTHDEVEGIHACPSEKHCLAILDSTAFLINTAKPGEIVVIGDGIRRVEKYLFLDMLFLLDFMSITAIGKDGILWTTPQLVRDGISIIEVTDKYIRGEGDYASSKVEGDCFKIDTNSGKIVEGNIFTELDIHK